MTTSCPKGHDSEWPDWCSVCGERLGAAPAAAESQDPDTAAKVASETSTREAAAPDAAPVTTPPAETTGPTCSNCGVVRHPDDVFCESCGYDFASGSLPEGSAPAGQAEAAGPPMHAKVSLDAEFFAASVGDVDLDLPDPLPQTQTIPLPGTRILIGRQSTSRGIFPEIDVLALTGDPAVSSRHAMLERSAAGDWSLTDLGSTNGTFLTADASDAIESGVALPVAPGMVFYLGAWTKIAINETTN